MTTNHLTTEQLYDLLDNPTLASDAHLRTCATCQLEFNDLRSSLENFRLAATGLAAAEMPQLASQPAERRTETTPRFAFRPFAFAASFATAAVLLVSASLIHTRPATPAIRDTAIVASTQESDADLLNGIQQDLSASVPPSLQPLEVAPR